MDASSILSLGFNRELFVRQGGWSNFRINSIPELAASGITHVWLPPPEDERTLVNGIKVCLNIIAWLFCSALWASGLYELIKSLPGVCLFVCLFICLLLGPTEYLPDWLYDHYASHYASQDQLRTWVRNAFQRRRIPCVQDIGINENALPAAGEFAFDFTTRRILQAALEGEGGEDLRRLRDLNGSPPGLIGTLPERAVTFIDNVMHDQPPLIQRDNIMLGYVYILTHPGIPSFFYEHFFDPSLNLKLAICELIRIRRRNGINACSRVQIRASEPDLYVAMIDDRIIAKIGRKYEARHLVPEGFERATYGNYYAVWERLRQ